MWRAIFLHIWHAWNKIWPITYTISSHPDARNYCDERCYAILTLESYFLIVWNEMQAKSDKEIISNWSCSRHVLNINLHILSLWPTIVFFLKLKSEHSKSVKGTIYYRNSLFEWYFALTPKVAVSFKTRLPENIKTSYKAHNGNCNIYNIHWYSVQWSVRNSKPKL